MSSSPDGPSDLRTRILAAAAQQFAENGYGSTSMRAICEQVGCTKPALYYWFRDKEQLFAEIARAALSGFNMVIEHALSRDGTLEQRLVGFAASYLDHARANPQSVRLLMAATHGSPNDTPRVDLMDLHLRNGLLIRAVLAEGVATGDLRADLNLDDATMALIGVVHLRALTLCHPMPVAVPAADPARIIDLLLRGISA